MAGMYTGRGANLSCQKTGVMHPLEKFVCSLKYISDHLPHNNDPLTPLYASLFYLIF